LPPRNSWFKVLM